MEIPSFILSKSPRWHVDTSVCILQIKRGRDYNMNKISNKSNIMTSCRTNQVRKITGTNQNKLAETCKKSFPKILAYLNRADRVKRVIYLF